MERYRIPAKSTRVIFALGAESAGNFAAWKDGILHHSEDYGDLLEPANWSGYQAGLNGFLKRNKMRPDTIACDLHPDFKTTRLAQRLAKKYRAQLIPVQHHIAHILSSVADRKIQNSKFKIQNLFYGIALDGTGYGLDGKIWGGEIFEITKKQETRNKQIQNSKLKIIRMGHLENQWMIGGEKAIEEPARIALAIASKIQDTRYKIQISDILKKYYSKNEIAVLRQQLEQEFNCVETSSCGRVLDTVSLLLGFCGNERKYKHDPIDRLEKNSTRPYENIKPVISRYKIQDTGYRIQDTRYKIQDTNKLQIANEILVLNTTFLFEYLIKNIYKDKNRLAATAQLYIAQGIWEIITKIQETKTNQVSKTKFLKPNELEIYLSGGIANNKIISSYLESKGVYMSKKIPRGDAGISAGQVLCELLNI